MSISQRMGVDGAGDGGAAESRHHGGSFQQWWCLKREVCGAAGLWHGVSTSTSASPLCWKWVYLQQGGSRGWMSVGAPEQADPRGSQPEEEIALSLRGQDHFWSTPFPSSSSSSSTYCSEQRGQRGRVLLPLCLPWQTTLHLIDTPPPRQQHTSHICRDNPVLTIVDLPACRAHLQSLQVDSCWRGNDEKG